MSDKTQDEKPKTSSQATLSGVTFDVTQPQPSRILGPIDLSITCGESLSVVGPSGAGKSTLISIIGGMQKPASGSYIFDGVEIASHSSNQLAAFRSRQIGFVFQAAHLIDDRTTVDNVALGVSVRKLSMQQKRQRAVAQLEKLDIAHLGERKAKFLSGGERQRVALARALVKNPALLIADEPTGNLDQKTGHQVLDLLYTLPDAGVTLLLVTHDMDAAARSSRTLRIVDGLIQEHS